jgi:MSHA biogenesis protein MshQ
MGRSCSSALVLVALVGCGRMRFDGVDEPDAAAPDAQEDDPLLRDCVLRLTMDEPAWTGAPGEVIDTCGGDDNGTAQNGATTVANGVHGRGGSFTEPMCVTIPDSPRLRATGSLTVSAWVYPTGLDQVNELGILSKRVDFNVEGEYSVFLWTGDKAWIDIDTEDDRFDGSVTFTNNKWQQLTMVYDGGRATGSRETAAAITQFGAPVSVGCLPLSGPAQSFIGQLDEVVVWRRALDATEVAQWYAATKP